MLEINAQHDRGCTGIEPAVLSSVEKLKQSGVTTRPRRPYAKQNSGKYIDWRPNGVMTTQKIMNELQKLEYQL